MTITVRVSTARIQSKAILDVTARAWQQCGQLTHWEQGFLDSMTDRVLESDAVVFTIKQLDLLEEVASKAGFRFDWKEHVCR